MSPQKFLGLLIVGLVALAGLGGVQAASAGLGQPRVRA